MQVKLISITQPLVKAPVDRNLTAEELIVYCARVSAPQNQLNLDTAPKLINYLIKNKHWSPLEMVSFCVEIKTSRAIAAQILRHRSFSFQEFSQRYAEVTEFEPIELRLQGKTNRQVGDEVIENKGLSKLIDETIKMNESAYKTLIEMGIAKESARFILPLNTQTTIYMTGSIRSWSHYLQLRLSKHTQKEHRLIAEEIKNIFVEHFPNISTALNDFKDIE